MSELWFYQMERQPLEAVLPKLLEMTLQKGWRAMVRCSTEARLEDLDGHLWTYRDDSFLPHGRAGDPNAKEHPILLTTGTERVNHADVLFLVERARFSELLDADAPPPFLRTSILFDARDDKAIGEARTLWREAKAKGVGVSYWEQAERGWRQKA